MRVVILGCGPAGLLAAHAVKLAAGREADVRIYSFKKKSPMAGAQFVHRSIPGIPIKSSMVDFKKVGTKEGYATKVYGDPNHPCSWEEFPEGRYQCWSMKAIYDWLWDRWEDRIVDAEVTTELLDEIEDGITQLLISTVPAPILCENAQHEFASSTVRITSKRIPDHFSNLIIYNGDNSPNTFYRSSTLFGWFSLEYGATQIPSGVWPFVDVVKPQDNDCDCRGSWMRVGRYGKWERGVLVHHGYEEVNNAVHQLL